MNNMNLKQKIKDHKAAIAIGVTALIGVSYVLVHATKLTAQLADDTVGNLIVGELVGDAATGEPLHLLTTFGTYDLTPHVEI